METSQPEKLSAVDRVLQHGYAALHIFSARYGGSGKEKYTAVIIFENEERMGWTGPSVLNTLMERYGFEHLFAKNPYYPHATGPTPPAAFEALGKLLEEHCPLDNDEYGKWAGKCHDVESQVLISARD